MPADDPDHKMTPTQSSETTFGDAHTHSQAGSIDRPGTQDALRGQGNSHARTEIPRDHVAPAQDDPSSQSSSSSLTKEDRSNVAGQNLSNKEREIPTYIATGKDESSSSSSSEPTEGTLSQPDKDHNDRNLVEAGTTMAGDADAYGGLRNTA